MATIQVRDVSDRAYAVIQRRARRAGQSIQAYMREQVERLADIPTDEELFEQAEDMVASSGHTVDRDLLLADRDAERR